MTEAFSEIICRQSRELAVQPTDVAAQLQKLVGIRGVLFDVYGTLFISGSGDIGVHAAESRADQLREALRQCGLDAPVKDEAMLDTEKMLDAFHQAINDWHSDAKSHGIRYPEVDIVEIWRRVIGSFFSSDLPVETLQRLAVEFEVRANPVWPMPGLQTCLESLQEYSLGIISNAQFFTLGLFDAFLDRPLEGCGFHPGLGLFSYQHGVAKPGTQLYEMAAERLSEMGIQPREVLYVGNDMKNDIWPAQQVGFRTALFAGDARSLRMRKNDPEVDGVQPDIIVTSLSQIRGCL